MMALLTHPDVTFVGGSEQAFVDTDTEMFVLASGGAYATTNAQLEYDSIVPLSFTFEAVVFFDQLPTNFSNLQERHTFIGVTDAAGVSFGLFISEVGLLYTGAVHFSGDDVVLDGPLQPLPNSQLLIETGEFYTIRIAASFDTGTAYIYWTKTSDVETSGHQLRFVLPALRSDAAITAPPDRTIISVRGTVTDPAILGLHNTCLGTGLLIPNLLPRANAGSDQAVRTCSTVLLDGSRSFDPEGTPLLYKWRLIDAPDTSSFVFVGHDGKTYPLAIPTGFAQKFYSDELAAEHALDPIVPDDVLVVDNDVHLIQATGTDGGGFYVFVELIDLPETYSGVEFSVLRQRGISEPLTAAAAFLPDKPGLYKFDLVVFDGGLYSTPAVTVVNVTESPLPRGLIPDLKFMWNYLSDFWRLVEDRERIEVFWSALAQLAASELLTFWQTDYSKSLRDVQRTFQRRWLHYDLLIKEPPETLELTTLRAVYGGLASDDIPTAGISGVAGTTLELFISVASEAVPVFFSGSGDLTAQQICDRINAFMHDVDPRIVARVIANRAGTSSQVRIDAPFGISVSGASTCTLFGVRANEIPQGSGGTAVGPRTYRVEVGLTSLDIQEGDLLTLSTGTYCIFRVIDDAADSYLYQRITLLEDIPLSAGADWLISGSTTSKSLDFYAALLTSGDVATFEVVDLTTQAITYETVAVSGVSAGSTRTLGIDTTMLGHFLAEPSLFSVYFFGATRRKYTPISPLVVDVPYLQELIKNTDDTLVLRRNIDFFIETFRGSKCIRFVVNNDSTLDIWEGLIPPARLWAELSYLDNNPVIEANFGVPAEFTLDDLSQLPDNVDYLSAVRGLWYAYFSGPTLFNVRAGVQILIGLPYAEAASTIEEIRDDFSSSQGRLLLRDLKDTEIVRTYTYPHGLDIDINPTTGVSYVVGDTVKQFAPLVAGAEVVDWVKSPRWFEGLLNQGSFVEVEKFFKFLVAVDSAAFNLSAILFVRQFILRIKPTYTFPVFVVRSTLGEAEVSVSDLVTFKGVLHLFAGPSFGSDGQAQMWDQPRAGGGGYWNQFDQYDPNGPAPTLPIPDPAIDWGFDEYLLAPREATVAKLTTVSAGGLPESNSIFWSDLPIFTQTVDPMVGGGIRNFLAGVPIQLGDEVTSAITATLNKLTFFFRGTSDGEDMTLELLLNAVVVETFTISTPVESNPSASQTRYNLDINVAVVPGDLLSLRLSRATDFNTYVESVGGFAGAGLDWASDVALPADTYFTYLVL
jgi:hypothetical protein